MGDSPPIFSPIFIVGCGHSGTTLLLAMLSRHSRLYSIPYESSLFRLSAVQRDEYVTRFGAEARAVGKDRWVEKTPRHIHSIGDIFATFPSARVLLMIRDGRDVACSLQARTGNFSAAVDRWLDDNAAADPFRDRDGVLEVRYEDLVVDPVKTLRTVTHFISEDFEPAMVSHHEGPFRFYGSLRGMDDVREQIETLETKPDDVSGPNHRFYRSWQVRQPIFDGRGRWRTQLSSSEQDYFLHVAGAVLVRYGYEV